MLRKCQICSAITRNNHKLPEMLPNSVNNHKNARRLPKSILGAR